MSDKFQNKYRIASARLQNWDYGWNATYFMTICTKNKENYFGEINDGKMILSETGVIADILWYEIKNHSDNIELDAFVVMPNHVHGIIFIVNPETVGGANDQTKMETNPVIVETRHALSLRPQPQNNQQQQQPTQPEKTIGQKRFQNQGKNTLSSIIGSYKSAVTKHAHRLNFDFNWQPRFYDHIIRDDNSFQRIRAYITNNPASWQDDKFFD